MTADNRDAAAATALRLQSLAARIGVETEAGNEATRRKSRADTGHAIAAGLLLAEAKRIVGEADWPDWLAGNTGLRVWADSYMGLAREWPALGRLKPLRRYPGKSKPRRNSDLGLFDALAELRELHRQVAAVPVRDFCRILAEMDMAGEPRTLGGMITRRQNARESVDPPPAPMSEPPEPDALSQAEIAVVARSPAALAELAFEIGQAETARITRQLRADGKPANAKELATAYAAARAQKTAAEARENSRKRPKPKPGCVARLSPANVASAKANHLAALDLLARHRTPRTRLAAYVWAEMAGSKEPPKDE